MKFLPLVLRNARRNRVRTALTILGSAFLIFVLVFMMTALTEMEAWEGQAATHLRVVVQHSTGLANLLPLELERYLEGDVIQRHAEYVQKVTWFGGYYQDPRNWFANFACEPDFLLKLWDEYKLPEDQYRAFLETKNGVIIGKSLADKFELAIGRRFTLIGTIYPVNPDLIVCGLYSGPTPREEEAMYFRWDYFDELMGRGVAVGTYWMRARTPEDIPKLKELIDGHTKNSSDPTETMTEKEFAQQFMAMMGNVKGLVTNLGVIVLVIMTLMTANTMAMNVRERVTEIAVLRTLGFPGGLILFLVLAESLMVTLSGAAIALGAALTLFNALRLSPVPNFFPYFFVAPVTVAAALGAALVAGFASAAIPAALAARRKIVDGLRQVA